MRETLLLTVKVARVALPLTTRPLEERLATSWLLPSRRRMPGLVSVSAVATGRRLLPPERTSVPPLMVVVPV